MLETIEKLIVKATSTLKEEKESIVRCQQMQSDSAVKCYYLYQLRADLQSALNYVDALILRSK